MTRLHQIKASAGSGKTYALTNNFLGALARCGEANHDRPAPGCVLNAQKTPETFGSVFALTFTNAAAAEMRERVLKKLKLCALRLSEEINAEKAEKWLETLLGDMDNLNVKTIDSLLHAIVRSAALDLGLHPDFKPVFDSREALAPYLDLYMMKALDQNDAAHHRLQTACMALVEYGPKNSFTAGRAFLDNIFKFVDGALKGEFADLSDKTIIEKKFAEMRAKAALAARNLLQAVNADPECSLKVNPRKFVEAMAAEDFLIGSASLKNTEPADFFPKKYALSPEVEAAFKNFIEAKSHIARNYELLKDALLHAPIAEIAMELSRAYRAAMHIEAACPTTLVPALARAALEAENGVADALCRLGNRIVHFLIDEFQDTSREQWEALRPLARNALASNGTLTWVGDLKQSIYGWRDADPSLFNAIIPELTEAGAEPSAQTENLPHNWRSSPEIVHFNNQLFTPLADREFATAFVTAFIRDISPSVLKESVDRLHASFENTEQTLPPSAPQSGGHVAVKTVRYGTSAEPSPQLLQEIRDTVKRIGERRPWSDVLVLCRSARQAALAAETLISAGIPVITENSLKLSSHPLIRQVIAFLKYMNDGDDDIAFMTLLCGSILQGHAQAKLPPAAEIHQWAAKARTVSLSRQFRRDFFSLWHDLFYPFERQAGIFTPYDTAREWLEFFDVEKRFPDASAFIASLLELLHLAEQDGLDALQSFLLWWEDKGAEEKARMPEKLNAARIMTIHKSKGLEAPAVVVPWTDFRLKYSDLGPMLFERDGLRLVAPLRKHAGAPYYKKIAAQLAENLDMLYVAFTRAKEELHIFTPLQEKKNSVPLLQKLLEGAGLKTPGEYGVEPERQKTPQAESHPQAIPTPQTLSARSFESADEWNMMEWLPELNVFRDPLNFASFKSEDRGEFLHYCLEHMPVSNNPVKSADAALAIGLAHSGIATPPDDKTRRNMHEALLWFASLPQSGRWLKDGLREQSIMNEDGTLMRVDNLVWEEWGLLILDYKSGGISDAHVAQMRKYINCLKKCSGKDQEVRAVLIYLDERLFRLVEADKVFKPTSEFPLE